MTEQPTESLDCFPDVDLVEIFEANRQEKTSQNINDYTFSDTGTMGMLFKSTPSFGYVMIDHDDRRVVFVGYAEVQK